MPHRQPRARLSTGALTLRNASLSQNREGRVIPWDRPRNSKARPGFAMLGNQEPSWAAGSGWSSQPLLCQGLSSGLACETTPGPPWFTPKAFPGDASSSPSQGWPVSKTPNPQKPFLPHDGCANSSLSEMPLTHSPGGAGGVMSLSRVLQNGLKESAGSCTLGCLSLVWEGGVGWLIWGWGFFGILPSPKCRRG